MSDARETTNFQMLFATNIGHVQPSNRALGHIIL